MVYWIWSELLLLFATILRIQFVPNQYHRSRILFYQAFIMFIIIIIIYQMRMNIKCTVNAGDATDWQFLFVYEGRIENRNHNQARSIEPFVELESLENCNNNNNNDECWKQFESKQNLVFVRVFLFAFSSFILFFCYVFTVFK